MIENKDRIIGMLESGVLADKTAWALEELASGLPDEQEKAVAVFCDRLELGNWFYEAMIVNEVDIVTVLIDLGAQRQKEEKQASGDHAEFVRDLQQMQA